MNEKHVFNKPRSLSIDERGTRTPPMRKTSVDALSREWSHGGKKEGVPENKMQQEVMCLDMGTIPESATQSRSPDDMLYLCSMGQEAVQHLMSNFTDIVSRITNVKLNENVTSTDNNKKIKDRLDKMHALFRRLRLIFDRCNSGCQQHLGILAETNIERLIPMADESDPRFNGPPSAEYRELLEENIQLKQAVEIKNMELKDIIDNMRTIVMEINVMLGARRAPKPTFDSLFK
ncbi:Mediator of RNA polymerase II transcription subunit 30 [Pseudolycoriella hygida]|uniref:Mediator of RNA polymerase II transcription subunit 30 n=1 Tax=Pseudolycoriella hygida TaxID=35572 RepID=A0A9Q0N5Y2_9DIPT|nr:Mediator of RNA polymerase II transcription subunit 30 [Pseudolycoriella hygida]